MDKQKQVEEMAKRLPTIEEIEKEYKEWAVGLLKVRFDLKPEAFDEHHKNNYSFENCADCLWNKIKGSIEELLWLRKNQLPENAVVLNASDLQALRLGIAKTKDKIRKETAEEFADRLKDYYNWGFPFVLTIQDKQKLFAYIDEIAKEITEGVKGVSR